MLSAVTSAMLLLLAAHSATTDYQEPAADLPLDGASAACLRASVSQTAVDLSVQLTALAALPAQLQQLQQIAQQVTQQVVSSQQETAQQVRKSEKHLQAQLTAVKKKLTASPCFDHCPDGWTGGGDSCFLVPSEKTSWYMAHGACARLDGRARLGSMHADTAAVITSLIHDKTWLGLHHVNGSSPWVWADGTDLDYTNWDTSLSQPDNGGELCALTDKSISRWHDYTCTDNYSYLCAIRH